MGYYKDCSRMNLSLAALLPAVADVNPITLKLEELVSDNRVEKGNRDDEPDTCPRRKRTRTGRKSKGEGLGRGWPSYDSLTTSSTFHRAQGHWAFEAVNDSCWDTAAEYLTQSAADFVAVQETTTLEASIAETTASDFFAVRQR